MNCMECQDCLVAFVEGLLDDEQIQDVQTHLQTCADCRQEETAVRGLQERLSAQGQSVHQVDLESAVLDAIEERKQGRSEAVRSSNRTLKIRSQIMNHPLSRFAVAAAVVAAVVVGWLLMNSTSNVALADVLARIETVAVYMFQSTTTVIGGADEDSPFNWDRPSTLMVSREHGYAEKAVIYLGEVDGQSGVMEMLILPEQRKAIMLNHREKQVVEMAFNEEMVRRQRGQRDARAVVRHVLECEYEQLDRRTVDGIACEGFRTTDPTYANGFLGDVRVELWVDVDTYLPVRLETETLRDGKRFLTVSDQYEWDVAVDAREFEPVIPEGYTSPMAGPVQMPAMDEPSLIKGLQMLCDFGADTYPEALTMQGMVAQMSGFKERVMNMMRQGDREGMKAFMKKHYDIDLGDEKPSMEQLTQATMRITLKLQGPCLFYATLVQDRKDPAYHGKVVTPADAALPLVRWRISESEYRVIFGDLHAETVDAQTLAELEAALPE